MTCGGNVAACPGGRHERGAPDVWNLQATSAVAREIQGAPWRAFSLRHLVPTPNLDRSAESSAGNAPWPTPLAPVIPSQ